MWWVFFFPAYSSFSKYYSIWLYYFYIGRKSYELKTYILSTVIRRYLHYFLLFSLLLHLKSHFQRFFTVNSILWAAEVQDHHFVSEGTLAADQLKAWPKILHFITGIRLLTSKQGLLIL